MIIWKSDQPFFVSNDKEGDCILLHFGLEYIDDIEISGERFFVFFQKDESGWQAKLDKDISYGIMHKAMINKLIIEINEALKVGSEFDVIGYVQSNKEADAYFSHMASWRKRYYQPNLTPTR